MAQNLSSSCPILRSIYPHLDNGDLSLVEDNLKRYLALAVRVYERLQAEKDGALTADPAARQSLPVG